MLQIDEERARRVQGARLDPHRGVETDGEVELEIEEAAEPVDDDDQIVERDGVRIFLNRVAADAPSTTR